MEQESQQRSLAQSHLSTASSELSLVKASERSLQREIVNLRESKKNIIEDFEKLKTSKSVDDLQMRELQDQLEAEQYFSVSITSSV